MFNSGLETFRPINVLLVQDDLTDAAWARHALAEQGKDLPPMRLVQVNLLQSAILRMQDTDDIHLILLVPGLTDVASPGECIDQIHLLKPDLPVVVLTDDEATGIAAMERGATCYLPMSRTIQQRLSGILFRIIDRYRTEEDLRRVVTSSKDGILIVNSRRQVLFTNEAAARLLDLNSDLLANYVFDYPISPNLVEIELPGNGTAEMRVDEFPKDGQVAMLITLREVTDRWHMDRHRMRYKRGALETG